MCPILPMHIELCVNAHMYYLEIISVAHSRLTPAVLHVLVHQALPHHQAWLSYCCAHAASRTSHTHACMCCLGMHLLSVCQCKSESMHTLGRWAAMLLAQLLCNLALGLCSNGHVLRTNVLVCFTYNTRRVPTALHGKSRYTHARCPTRSHSMPSTQPVMVPSLEATLPSYSCRARQCTAACI